MGAPWQVLGGFAAGGVAMIVLKWIVHRVEARRGGRQTVPVGLGAAAAFDTLIDGAIIGAGFSIGEGLGALLAIALAVELLFLTLSVGSEYHRGETSERWLGIGITTGIALMLVVGVIGATWLLRGAAEPTIALVLAFGAAALLYLVAEELLVEAIAAEESLFSTAMLFLGFLAVLALILFRSTLGG